MKYNFSNTLLLIIEYKILCSNSGPAWTLAHNAENEIHAALKSEESAQTANNISRDEICDWKVNGTDTYYHTTCGEIVQSILDIEGMKFCPYCSRKLHPC